MKSQHAPHGLKLNIPSVRSKKSHRRYHDRIKSMTGITPAMEELVSDIVLLKGYDHEYSGTMGHGAILVERAECERKLAKLERKAEAWSATHATRPGQVYHVSETAGMTHHQRRNYLEAKRAAERAAAAEEADLRAFAEAKARAGDPKLGLKYDESTPGWDYAVSKYMAQERQERERRATVPAAAAAAAAPAAVGGAGTGSDAPRWGRTFAAASAAVAAATATPSALAASSDVAATAVAVTGSDAPVWGRTKGSAAPPPPSSSSDRPLPAALDALLKTLPVCYKSLGGGRFAIELHRQKLRALCVAEGCDVSAKEVEEILRAEVSSLCAIEEGSWGTLCVLRI